MLSPTPTKRQAVRCVAVLVLALAQAAALRAQTFVYAAHSGNLAIAGFRQDPASGLLSPVQARLLRPAAPCATWHCIRPAASST